MATQDEPELERWVDDRMATLSPDQEEQPDVDHDLAQLEARRAQETKRRPIGTWLVSAAVVVWIGAMVVTLGPWPANESPPEDGAVGASATRPTPGMAPAEDAPSPARQPRESVLTQIDERRDAPHFTLPDVDGGNAMLADYSGRVLLLNFWATWCGPCKVEMPWFVDFEDRFADEGFAVVGVSLDEPGWDIVRPFLERQPLNYRIALADTPERLAPFGETYVLPKTWLIDREGRIAAEHIGLVDFDSIESQIRELVSE
jgi:cytochrome c biogenesis protein CcmG/thiol:disulfide interchange protein DsbE